MQQISDKNGYSIYAQSFARAGAGVVLANSLIELVSSIFTWIADYRETRFRTWVDMKTRREIAKLSPEAQDDIGWPAELDRRNRNA